ncbi:autotransporter translocation and assembly factor TamB [Haloferula luteola]|uniref:Autotransporter translocation and assembly factor TamB n=1 Tax=Haloferula luteola TaxID=595692 RepID=A0A840V0X5_9BACT|nr:translocation/assembly module TamB domain-containing protein [Haloferula luteola]MBB5352007.1 autotransporter translocation and assembly factor TamB [Haloferula luteola]
MAESPREAPPKKLRRPVWKKKRLWMLFALLGGLLWFNGPGWRWIAQRASSHYLPALGLTGSLEFDGRLSSGQIGVRKVSLEGDALVQVAGLDQVELRYRWPAVIQGKVDGIMVEGLHVEVDLDKAPPQDESDDSPPADPAELLRSLHERLAPMNLQLAQLSVEIRRGSETLFSLAPSSLQHDPGSSDFRLGLGEMKITDRATVPAQTTELTWESDRLTLDQLELLRDVRIRDLAARFQLDQPPVFSTGIEIDQSRLDLETDLKTATAHLSDRAPLSLSETLKKADLTLPLAGEVTTFDLTIGGLEHGWSDPSIQITLGTQGVSYDDWSTRDLLLTGDLSQHHLEAKLNGTVLDSSARLALTAELDPDQSWTPLSALVDLRIDQLNAPLEVVRQRFELGSEDRPPPPDAELTAKGALRFEEGQIGQSSLVLDVTPRSAAPPLHLEGTWAPEAPLGFLLRIPSVEAKGTWDFETTQYQAQLTTNAWSPASLAPWCEPFGIPIPEGFENSLSWQGTGDLKESQHQGNLTLSALSVTWSPENDPLHITANATYDWPQAVEVSNLSATTGSQRIHTAANFSHHRLALTELQWHDGEDLLVNGKASLPVPGDPSDWKAILRSEEEAEIDLTTTELRLARLHPFLPETVRFTDASRGKVAIQLTGTPAEPILDATLWAADMQLDSVHQAPPVSADLHAVGRETTLKLEGQITTPQYPPAIIDAFTRWEPELWANDPETVRNAPLEATVRLDNLKLDLFSDFVPQARRLAGTVNLDAEVTGTVGEPKPTAELHLEGGTFETADPSVPRVSNGTMELTATPEKVTLETLSATVSGGSLNARGTLDLVDAKPGPLDVTLQAKSLPAIRDDSMIVRLNADLALRGPWESATLSGSLGVVDSLFHRDVEILPLGGPVRSVAEPELPSVDTGKPEDLTASIPAPFRDWKLDLRAGTTNPFLVRGNIAGGEAYLAAKITGTVGAPRPDGKITLREVSAKLPFSTLNIDKGFVVLRPDHPFDPILDIKGHSSVRPYEIDLYVYGPVSDPQIQPTSNPPLPESEVYTLLASGTTTSGIEDTNAATARAAQLVIEEFRRGRLGHVPGLGPLFKVLDRVDFQVGEQDPYTSRKYNSVAFKLDNHWLLTAGISEQGNTRSKITYLIRFR